MKQFDVIIIGAGPSGLMAAISAAQMGSKTLILERNKRIGKKLLLTGGGRCNVTNNRPTEDLLAHIPGNGKFLYSAFSQFDQYDVMNFFETHGTHLKEEDHGRMFPVTDQSRTIVETLYRVATDLGVTIWTEQAVTRLLCKDQQILGVATKEQKIYAPCVIVTTGGRAYPSTGSTGAGYQFAKKVGHTITPLFATEAPLVSQDAVIQKKVLQGLSLQDIQLSVLNQKGKVIVSQTHDLLFTHFGLSGPAALRCASFINQELVENDGQPVTIALDFYPEKTAADLFTQFKMGQQQAREKQVKTFVKTFLPERLSTYLCMEAQIAELPLKQVTEAQFKELIQLIKNFTLRIQKTFPLEKAFVTGGGVSLKEVTPKTMASKLVAGLFFAGEVLDIHAYTGGFNITAAFVTGYVAGQHAAEQAWLVD